MKLVKYFVVWLFGLLMVAMVAAYLIPLDAYIPEVEKAVGVQLQQPVSIRHLRFAVLPVPHLELKDVQLGVREKIVLESVAVEPGWLGLLAGRKMVRRIVLRKGVAPIAPMRQVWGWFVNTPVSAQSMRVRELQFSGVSLMAPGLVLGPIEGTVEFTPAGQLERARLAANEQQVTATLLPQLPPGTALQNRLFSVQVQARNWGVAQVPVDDLQLRGVLGERDFVAQKFAVVSRGMRIAGFGKVEFIDGWRVHAAVTRMEGPLEQVMALAGRSANVTGTLSATGEFNAVAATPLALKDDFLFAGDVTVSQATVQMSTNSLHPLLFDEIRARFAVRPTELTLSGLDAKLYSGRLSGTASINRKDNVLTGEIVATNIAMQPVAEAFTNKLLFTGSLESAGQFSARLDTLERFPEGMQANGNFHLVNGVLTNVDLLQAARNPGKDYATGGATRFDDLTGLFTVDAGGYHFRKLKIASGSLNAEGKVDISPDLQLAGMLDVDVKRTVGLVSMPMAVSGTLDSPVVTPSKSALAGAAVGTAILGPGLGTAAGIKIGGLLNKLMGRGSDKVRNKSVAPARQQ
ncbi:MAG TPA: AsmA-like C-terminal region-containing protein [Gallionella sp.]|nr:AsmA-like C-terminal region-containing protein [Gallionella sp.]